MLLGIAVRDTGSIMRAIQGHFDGKSVIVGEEARSLPPGDVIVVFNDADGAGEKASWFKIQERAFEKVWNNDEDAVYDNL